MARQSYNVNAAQKQLEVYTTYQGGMVSQVHPEKLNDSQSVLIENADVWQGGALESRGAYYLTNSSGGTVTGYTQGRFHYEDVETGGHELVAVNGQLYQVSGNTYTQLPITNLASFQNTRPIESVQLRNMMYIATGSGLVQYDGTTASLVQPYVPNGLEYMYVGSNGYSHNPEGDITDAVGTGDTILAVIPDQRYGVINTQVTFTAYVSKPTATSLDYQFETAPLDTGTYTVNQAWSTTKTFPYTFSATGDYMVRVSIRVTGTTTVLQQYVLPKYTINSTPNPNPEKSVNFDNIASCNRILLYYDRILLYGDATNPSYLYISHLNNFGYYPKTNLIEITDPYAGAIQSIRQFRTYVVIFTNASIQMMTGTSPADYQIIQVHSTLGTNFPYSVQVMRNYLIFVGNDNGMYILKPIRTTSLMMDVQRIDDNVRDDLSALIKTASNILTAIYNNQYYMYVENIDSTYVYRYYYDLTVWVRDVIPMNLGSLYGRNNVLYAASASDGKMYTLDKTKVLDDGNTQFTLRVISKSFNFEKPNHRKKLKQFQLITQIGFNTTVMVNIYADDNLQLTAPLIYDYTQEADTQKLKVMCNGRFRTTKTDMTVLIKEPITLVGFGFIFKENTPK